MISLAVRKELITVSVGEIDHDGAGLEDRNRRAVGAVSVLMAGILPLGLMRRKSSANCSPFPIWMGMTRYGKASSSRRMLIL